MNRNCPTPTLRLLRCESSVCQPAPVEEFSSTVCCGGPCHRRNGFNNFAQFPLTPLQPLVLALQFSLCDVRSPEIEIVIYRKCDDTTNQSQEANVVTAVNRSR